MQSGQDGYPETGDDLEDLSLMADVEVVGRLIQDQVVGALRQRPGDEDELLLAAGQGVEAAPGQVLAADSLDGLVHGAVVGAGVPTRTPACAGSGRSSPSPGQ